jgi:hypothetical protein
MPVWISDTMCADLGWVQLLGRRAATAGQRAVVLHGQPSSAIGRQLILAGYTMAERRRAPNKLRQPIEEGLFRVLVVSLPGACWRRLGQMDHRLPAKLRRFPQNA